MVVTVNADAITTLRTAYEVMLSLGKIKTGYCEPLIDENLLFARASIKPNKLIKPETFVMINVEAISPNLSKLSVCANLWEGLGGISSHALLLITDILSGVSQRLSTESDPS